MKSASQQDFKADYLTQKGFAPDAFHGFFTRKGGVSGGLYNGLNCGVGSRDDADSVQMNRALVAEATGVEASRLVSVHQVHSEVCVYVHAPIQGEKPQADAMVTDIAGLALGVLTADCTPVLFYGVKGDGKPIIGAAHAGWGGAFKGVLEATVEMMRVRGAMVGQISACIGPCIAQGSYEVQDAFMHPIVERDDIAEKFFMSGQKAGYLMFDLSGYCAFRLAQAGVNNVAMMDRDTYGDEAHFYSYRRATHRNEVDYGRQISVIALRA